MRLLLWVLLATLIAFLSSCEAASDANKPLQRALYSTLASRGAAVDNVFNDGKRLLRDESNNIVKLKDEDEERAIGSKLNAALRRIKVAYLAWEQKILTPGFKKMAEKGTTYEGVLKNFRTRMMGSGRWGTPSGFKRYARLYKEWCERNGFNNLAKA